MCISASSFKPFDRSIMLTTFARVAESSDTNVSEVIVYQYSVSSDHLYCIGLVSSRIVYESQVLCSSFFQRTPTVPKKYEFTLRRRPVNESTSNEGGKQAEELITSTAPSTQQHQPFECVLGIPQLLIGWLHWWFVDCDVYHPDPRLRARNTRRRT